MSIFGLMGLVGFSMVMISLFMIRKPMRAGQNLPLLESFSKLLTLAIHQFNRRILIIFIQFILISNILLVAMFWFQNKSLSVMTLAAFDLSLILFSITVYVMLQLVPSSLLTIINSEDNSIKYVMNKIIYAGLFQTILFFGCFISVLFIYLLFFDLYALLALSAGVLIMSFYYRSAGGAYKAAAEKNLHLFQKEKTVLTHPADLLIKAGTIIASIGGYYLDIFGSWLIAIATFFVFVNVRYELSTFSSMIELAEIQWVIAVVFFTGLSTLFAIPFIKIRKNTSNIFLEIGYVMIGLTFIALFVFSNYINLFEKESFFIGMAVALVSMLGIAFFTNYLTSGNHQPIQFISKQAQYGGANVLISSFFNGLIANAFFTLLILILLFYIYNTLGILGIMMIIIYALSIAVVACSIKVFSIYSNQVVALIEYNEDSLQTPIKNALKKVSYTLVAIGNSFSSAAGLLSSSAVIIAAIALLDFELSIVSADVLFGGGLGVVTMAIFYCLSISGTYRALVDSSKEIRRQLSEIPQINEENKSHPNIERLSDQHSINGLKAVTWPGVWVLMSLVLIFSLTSLSGFYGALLGMFLTVFIQSFFWSIFGDSVSAAYKLIKQGRFGGANTDVFKQVQDAFLYAHYFQWVLAPTGVIIMKFVGIMAIISALI